MIGQGKDFCTKFVLKLLKKNKSFSTYNTAFLLFKKNFPIQLNILSVFFSVGSTRTMPKLQKEKNKNITIAFTATYSHKEICSSFQTFLIQENCINNWNFILQTLLLNSQIEKKQYQLAVENMNNIIEIFFITQPTILQLTSDATNELNTKLLLCWKNQQLGEVSALLDALKDILLEEYQINQFQKFLLTPKSKTLIEKYIKDKKIVVPKITEIFDYHDEDFSGERITQKDIEFFQHVSNEKTFSQSTDKVDCFGLLFTDYNYFPNLTFLNESKIIRCDLIFDYPLEQTACVLLDNYLGADTNSYIEVLDYQKNEYFVTKTYVNVIGFVPKIRKSVFSMSYDVDKIVIYRKAIKMEETPFQKPQILEFKTSDGKIEKKKGIQEFHFSHAEFIKINDNKTLFKSEFCTGSGKKSLGVPQTIVKWKFNDLYTKFIKKLKKTSGCESIVDYKKRFTRKKDGMPVDPMSHFLYDLYIQKHGEIENEKTVLKNIIQNKSDENLKVVVKQETNESTFIMNILEEKDLKMRKHSKSEEKYVKQEEQNFNAEKSSNNQIEDKFFEMNFEKSKLEIQLGAFGDSKLVQPISEFHELVSFIEEGEYVSLL